jgi:hypothetical protein
LLFAQLGLCFSFSQAEAADMEPRGKVEIAQGGVWAVRANGRVALIAGSDVFEFDVLETDASGAAVVRFVDDSLLELRGDTRIDVKEVVFTNDRKRFNVGVMHGAARIITGVIVKQNPNGFKMTTPKSTIGIRGTILTVVVTEAIETVTVNELSEGSRVTHSNKETGETKTMTMPGDTVSITTSTVENPTTGVISTTTTTETSGAGVIDGNRDQGGFDRSGGGDNPHDREGRNESGGGGGGEHSHSGGTSPGGGGCGGGNSAPGRSGALNSSC